MAENIQILFTLQEVVTTLLKEQKIHSGFYEIGIELQVAVGTLGPAPEAALPGAMFGVKRIGLNKVEQMTPLSVDAAVANPVK